MTRNGTKRTGALEVISFGENHLIAGRLKFFTYYEWLKINRNSILLSCVEGYNKLPFVNGPQQAVPFVSKFSTTENAIMQNSIDNLLKLHNTGTKPVVRRFTKRCK